MHLEDTRDVQRSFVLRVREIDVNRLEEVIERIVWMKTSLIRMLRDFDFIQFLGGIIADALETGEKGSHQLVKGRPREIVVISSGHRCSSDVHTNGADQLRTTAVNLWNATDIGHYRAI